MSTDNDMLTREQAAQILGVPGGTLIDWVRTGKVTFWQWFHPPTGGQRRRVYPRAAVKELARQRATTSFPPPGYVRVDEARQIFGVAPRTWNGWEKKGRITCGRRVAVPGRGHGHVKIYPINELERMAAEWKRQEEEENRRLTPYPDPDRAGCWRLPLQSTIHDRMEAIIDADTLPLVQGKRWWWTPGSGDGNGSVVEAVSENQTPLRQLIMGVRSSECRVCHVNGDHLDYRRENLVVRTRAEQTAASRKATVRAGRPASSRFKGVSWDADRLKWRVAIKCEGVKRELGTYISEVDAALVYDDAARELYGHHARLNITDEAEADRLRATRPPPPQVVRRVRSIPPEIVDLDDASHMLNVPAAIWTAWDEQGRIPVQAHEMATPAGGRCKAYRVEDLSRLRGEIERLWDPYLDPRGAGFYRVPLKSFVYYREAIIDSESVPLVGPYDWHWSPRHGFPGEGHVLLLSQNSPLPSRTPLARLVSGVATAGRMTRVSHRNGDRFDCRRENLIVRTFQEQAFSCRKIGTRNGRECSSRYKGVSWNAKLDTWAVYITKDGLQRYLGLFRDEVAAAEKYDEAARELFGEHARLNFPDGIDAALEHEAAEAA